MQFFPTVDEDVQYFRSEGYTGSINDMHYAALGDLGYSGALTDRLRAYLLDEFGSYYEAMRDLRNGTSVFALLSYKVLDFNPALVLDFDATYYRTDGTATDLVSAATHTRAGNATMVDSDGVLKWAPHNLLTYSEDFTNAVWAKASGVSVSADAVVAPNGETVADIVSYVSGGGSEFLRYASFAHSVGVAYTFSFWIKAVSGETSGTLDQGNLTSQSFTATSEWQLVSHSTTFSANNWWDIQLNGAGTIAIYGAHLYRSDLGGMVDNPATGDSYVPTTDAAKYLPRVGHHIWNGSAWVNEGYFHESEARTNLLLNSDTLATQSVTVTAVPHTLHFTGTGTVTLTGASTAGPLVGTGTGENNRVSLTFTPTAGTLTATVSGTVTNAGLEVGSTLSSYIPTAGATVTRAADAMTIPAANLPWNPLAVSIQMEGTASWSDKNVSVDRLLFSWAIDGNNLIRSYIDTGGALTGRIVFQQNVGGTQDFAASGVDDYSPGINVPFNIASRHGSTFINGAVDGVALTANTTPTALPYLENTDMQVAPAFNGTIKLFRVWADDLTDEGIAEASA